LAKKGGDLSIRRALTLQSFGQRCPAAQQVSQSPPPRHCSRASPQEAAGAALFLLPVYILDVTEQSFLWKRKFWTLFCWPL